MMIINLGMSIIRMMGMVDADRMGTMMRGISREILNTPRTKGLCRDRARLWRMRGGHCRFSSSFLRFSHWHLDRLREDRRLSKSIVDPLLRLHHIDGCQHFLHQAKCKTRLSLERKEVV
jgi:hypothetical protein